MSKDIKSVKINGLIFVSALAHELVTVEGLVIPPNPELAKSLSTTPVEKVVNIIGYLDTEKFEQGSTTLVSNVFLPSEEGLELARTLIAEGFNYIISSIIGANAYKELGGVVVSPITTPETSRLSNSEKRIFSDKWNVGV